MSTDDIFIQELYDGLGICFFQGSGFDPFGEMVDCDDDVTFAGRGSGQGSHYINSNLVEWFWVLLDGF